MQKDYKLTREQFAGAISKGLGRTMMHIKTYGLDDVSDILLDACIHNKIYDAQCEDRRADWLYSMFKDSPHYNDFRDAILSALEEKHEWHEIAQLCELAKEMALDGDEYARAALKDYVLKSAATPSETEEIGVEEYIKLDRNDAVLELARIYGQRLIENPEEDVFSSLCDEDEDCKAFKELLKEHSYSDPKIKVYLEYLEENDGLEPITAPSEADIEIERENRKIAFLSQYSAVEQIIDFAKIDEQKNRYIFRTFGKYAEQKDLKVICEELLKTKEDAIRKRLLWVFWRNPLPAMHDCFFEWADSEDEELRVAILSALANSKDDRVHEFAIKRIKAGKILGWGNSFVLDIFEKNFANEDVKIIYDAILASKPTDEDDIHRFGLSITSIAEKNKTSELKDMLIWVYENTPCSNCRELAVTRLNEIGELKQEMIDECMWDGGGDMREFVNSLIK